MIGTPHAQCSTLTPPKAESSCAACRASRPVCPRRAAPPWCTVPCRSALYSMRALHTLFDDRHTDL